MSGSLALVTGATGGLGGALSHALAQRGHDLLLVGRNKTRLDTLCSTIRSEYGGSVEGLRLDLSASDSIDTLLSACEDRPLRVVALAAASYAHGPLASLDPDQHAALLQCNVIQQAALVQRLLARLDQEGEGSMLVVGSLGALLPAPGHAAYSASKAWLHQLVSSVQAERGKSPVTLTLACPGGMATPMLLESPAWPVMKRSRLIRASVLSPTQAARQILLGMDRGRWRVVPGWINRATVLLCHLLPHGLAIHLSARIYPQQASTSSR